MSQLPIRKLTLYKQGIGYFERRGQVNGSTISLDIPRKNINDTLKSLSIINHGDGKIFGVDYETPADKETLLKELSIKLADRASMVDLLQSLRGRRVSLQIQSGDTAAGRLIGVETSLNQTTHEATVLLQDSADLNNIQIHPIASLLGLTILDDRATTDVSFFLDVSQIEQTRTTLTIRLSEGEHDLEIGYLAPSPTWRVSYQLVSNGRDEARLLGWGLFDNGLDEDLEDTSLTLKSGRPISFEYDLYESYVPSRPQVSDDPMALEAISNNPLVVESIATISHELRTPITSIIGYSDILSKEIDGPINENQKKHIQAISQSSRRLADMVNDLLDMARLREGGHKNNDRSSSFLYRSGPLGDLKVSNAYFKPMLIGNAAPEFLTYEVETPVSVRRKQSAMVPIIDYPVSYKEICVYNGDKMPNHPLRVWRLRNTTGKALEQGPVTLVKEGQYLGEALMQFTGVGDELHLPYALEFGIVVSEDSTESLWQVAEIKFDGKKRRAIVRRHQITESVYLLASHIERETTVFVERRNPNQGEYHQMPEPDLDVLGHTRWPVTVPGNGKSTFTIKIRTVYSHEEDIANWDRDFVNGIHSDGLLDDATFNRLENYWSEKQKEAVITEQGKALQAEYNQLLLRQQQLRENLKTLGSSDRETEIRNRILDDLELSENRRRELEAENISLGEKMKQSQAAQHSLMDQIYS